MADETLFPLEIDPKRKIGEKTEAQWQSELEAKARELCSGAKNDGEKCDALYRWLKADGGRGSFRYKTLFAELPKRAVQTFADRTGDCDDMAYLFMAMAKAVGVQSAVAERNRNEAAGEKTSHTVAAVLLHSADGAIGPNTRFEKDLAFRKAVCSNVGRQGASGLHLYFFDLTSGGFDPNCDFSIGGGRPAVMYNARGLALEKQKKYTEAISAYDHAAKADPENGVYTKNLANCFNLRGSKSYGEGKIGEAIADYKMALKINPKIVYTNRNLYLCYMKMDDLKNAAAYLEAHVMNNPTDPESAKELQELRFRMSGNVRAARH